jgi:signal peptidase
VTTSPIPRSSLGGSLAHWAGRLLVLAFAVVVGFAVVVVAVIPRLTGGQALTVLSGSMTPGIPVGSVVMVRPVDPGALRVGDVATYQAEPNKPVYITHRIVAIGSSNAQTVFTFKGDANRGPDVDPVVAGQIRGKVWFHVPWLGRIRDDLKTRAGITLLLALLLAGYAVSQLSAAVRERHRTRPEEHAHVPA